MKRRGFLARAVAFLVAFFGAKKALSKVRGSPYRAEGPGERSELVSGGGGPSIYAGPEAPKGVEPGSMYFDSEQRLHVYEGPDFTIVELERGGVYESTDGMKRFGMRCDGCGSVSVDAPGPNVLAWLDDWRAGHMARCGRFVPVVE